jgi:hypothetical protein
LVHATVKTGLVASAAVWVTPQISSVALDQTMTGSPPPTTTTTPTTGSDNDHDTTTDDRKPNAEEGSAGTKNALSNPAAPAAPVQAPPNFTK